MTSDQYKEIIRTGKTTGSSHIPVRVHKPFGRPPKYTSPEQMQLELDQFFIDQEEKGHLPTVTGMLLALGFADRSTLIDYERNPKFSHTIRNAKQKCFEIKMQAAFEGKITGQMMIFDAINNHGMVASKSHDKRDVDVNASISLSSILADVDEGGLSLPNSQANQQLPHDPTLNSQKNNENMAKNQVLDDSADDNQNVIDVPPEQIAVETVKTTKSGPNQSKSSTIPEDLDDEDF